MLLREIPLKLVYMAIVVWTIVTMLFFLIRMSGDPVAILAGEDATPERVEQVRESYGLDEPVVVQYARFIEKAVLLDFGDSFRYRRDAFPFVLGRLGATLKLAGLAMALTVLVALPAGILAAIRRGKLSSAVVMLGSLMGQSIPNFWLAIMLIWAFSVQLQVLPSFGDGGIKHLILPAVALSALPIARQARLVRSGMLEVLSQDYIRTARSKGLRETVIIYRHAIKNMMIPILAVVGLDVAYLVAGSVVIETVFAYPGIGSMLVTSVLARDYPAVQAAVFLISILVVSVNVVVDLSYRWLDPRIGAGSA